MNQLVQNIKYIFEILSVYQSFLFAPCWSNRKGVGSEVKGQNILQGNPIDILSLRYFVQVTFCLVTERNF